MIAVMVGGEGNVELPGQLFGRNNWRRDLLACAEVEIDADEQVVRLDEPPGVAGPPDRQAFVVMLNLLGN